MALTEPKKTLSVAIGSMALLVSCQLNSEPRRDVPSGGRGGSPWMPQTAAEADRRSATAVSMAKPVDVDSGVSRVVEADAGLQKVPDSGPPREMEARDAAAVEPVDASQPMRDASAPVRDASQPRQSPPDAGAPPESARDASPPRQSPPDAGALPATALCEPGLYTGTFAGQIDAAGAALSSVTGSVRAQLVWDVGMLYMLITDARVMGLDQDGNTLTVSLSGAINCITGLIEDGRLDNGVFHIAEAATDLTFLGTVEGSYSRDQQTLLGTWSGAADASSLIAGRGSFSLVASQ